jgi:hypothetical protein
MRVIEDQELYSLVFLSWPLLKLSSRMILEFEFCNSLISFMEFGGNLHVLFHEL